METVRARECDTEFQQTELMDIELGIALSSDKDKDCLTGYWAQECPFAGKEEGFSCSQGHHHHPGVAGLAGEGRDQARSTTAEVGSGQDITGKCSKFQTVTSFWKEQYGEGTQESPAGHHDVVDEAHGRGTGGVEREEEVQADVGTGRPLTIEQGGQVMGGPELPQGHQGVVVGDGFKEVFRKVARAGRRKAPPDGKIQKLMTNFMSLGGIDENSSKFISRNVGGTGSKRKLTAEAPCGKKVKFLGLSAD